MEFDKIDIEEIRKTLSDIKDKCSKKIDDAYVMRQHKKVMGGIKAIDDLQPLMDNLSSNIKDCDRVMEGIKVLTTKEKGSKLDENSKKVCQNMMALYYGRDDSLKGFLTKPLRKLFGDEEITLRQGFDLLYRVTSALPDYIGQLKSPVASAKDGLNELKHDIRDGIETIITDQPAIKHNREEIQAWIDELEQKYEEKENIRQTNSSQGKASDPELITWLGQAELALSAFKDKHTDYLIKEKRAQNKVDMLNSQIREVSRTLELSRKVNEKLTDAQDYINTQVPHMKIDIEMQRAGVQGLTGADGVLTFIEKYHHTFKPEVHKRMDMSADYIGKRLDNIRQNTIEASSAYILHEEREIKELNHKNDYSEVKLLRHD